MHWERTEQHARRVRIMESLQPEFKETVDISALQALAFRCRSHHFPDPPSTPFLPNLRILSWPYFQNEAVAFALIPMIAGPELRKFHSYALYTRPDNSYLAQILQVISEFPDKFPALESIQMPSTYTVAWNTMGEIFSTGLQKLHRLRRINLPSVNLTREAMQHLAALPDIEQLEVAGVQMFDNFIPPGPSIPFFPSLRILRLIEVPDLVACTMFIKSLSQPLLESVDFSGDFNTFTTAALVDHANALGPHKAMKKISVHANYRQIPDVPPNSPALDISFVQPLLSLPDLHTVDVSAPVEIDLRDSDILQMAKSWSKIERLIIRSVGRCRRIPSATFDSFLYVAHHCLSLRRFQLHLEPNITEEAVTEAALRKSQSAVEWISMKYQSAIPPHETDRLGKFLLDLFPKLRFVRALPTFHMDADVVPITETWSNFCTLLRTKIRDRDNTD